MQPTHHEGDLVIVDTDVSIKDLDYGDVIVFEADPQYGWTGNASSICHRVFSIEDGYVLTHGDHNEYVDAQPIDDSTLIGRCVMHMPKMGWLVDPKVLLPIATAGLMFAMYGLVTNKTASDAQGQLVQVWPTYAEFCERRRQAALAGHAMAQ